MRLSLAPKRRKAYSLIECIVFLTAIAVVLGLTAVLIQRLLMLERADRHRIEDAQMIERLGETLRSDSHAAIKPTTLTEKQLTLDRGDEGLVSYQVEPSRLVRTLNRKNKTVHHDVFALPARTSVKFELRGTSAKPEAVALVIDRASDLAHPVDRASRSYQLEASLGRFAHLAQEAKP